MTNNDYPPREFCRESKCIHYNLIQRLESKLSPQEILTDKSLGIARVQCQQACERTAYQLNEWTRKPINSSKYS